MGGFPILSLMLLVPMIGAIACLFAGEKAARTIALVATLVDLALQLRDDGVALEHVDVGGGLGIAYEGRPTMTPAEYAAAILPELRRGGIPVVLEPGRVLLGRAGALVSRVVDVKQYPDGRRFAVLDAGMTELMRK